MICMIKFYYQGSDNALKQTNTLKPNCWIHVENALHEDLKSLSEMTGIEYDILQDSLDKYEIPRIEQKNDVLVLFVRHPYSEEQGLKTATLEILVTPQYFITISPYKCLLIDTILSSNINFGLNETSKCLLHLLSTITHEFTLQMKKVRSQVIEQEKEMIAVDQNSFISLTKNEEKLNQYLAALVPLRGVLEALYTKKHGVFYGEDTELLHDLLIGIKQSEDLCQINVKSIRSLRDGYQILFTNDLNKTIKILTAITIIFTIPTTIASFYGMNIPIPFEHHRHAFTFVVIISLVFCGISLWIFRRKNWL